MKTRVSCTGVPRLRGGSDSQQTSHACNTLQQAATHCCYKQGLDDFWAPTVPVPKSMRARASYSATEAFARMALKFFLAFYLQLCYFCSFPFPLPLSPPLHKPQMEYCACVRDVGTELTPQSKSKCDPPPCLQMHTHTHAHTSEENNFSNCSVMN